jgi:hypothetical protein
MAAKVVCRRPNIYGGYCDQDLVPTLRPCERLQGGSLSHVLGVGVQGK